MLLLNIFDNILPLPPLDSLAWTWGRATLYKFMLASGFVFGDKVSYYEVSKKREDIVSMRDNYPEWIDQYGNNGNDIYYQEETWVFKNISTDKV